MMSDSTSYDRQFTLLRVRLLEVARRRVPEADAEDLVQDTLAVIHDRASRNSQGGLCTAHREDPGASAIHPLPSTAWCFKVLRNVIGNWYQRRAVRDRREDAGVIEQVRISTSPLEQLLERDSMERIQRGLEMLQDTDPRCGRYLERILDGAEPAVVASEEGIDPGPFYRRLYRCRVKLRDMLQHDGDLI